MTQVSVDSVDLPEGWLRLAFAEGVREISRTKPSIPQTRYQPTGRYPVIDQGTGFIAGFTDVEDAIHSEDLPVIVFGDHTRALKYVDFPFATGADGTKLLRAESGIDPKFLYFALLNLQVPSYGYSRHFRWLKESEILAPVDPREQRAIAGMLSAIREALDLQSRRVACLEELKAATMKKVFGEGVRGERRKATEVGEIPESWEVVPLGRVCRIASGGTPSRDEPQYWGGSIPWVRTGEISYRTITRTEETITAAGLAASSAKIFPVGTLLMAMYGQGVTRGKVARLGIRAATNQACAAFFPDEKQLTTEFLYAYFSHSYERLREAGHGANQKNLSADLLKGIPVPIPADLDEQRVIFGVLDGLERALDAAEQRLRSLEALFASTLHLMMIGKVRFVPVAGRSGGGE
jgi:type I restriction enzyme S subunit